MNNMYEYLINSSVKPMQKRADGALEKAKDAVNWVTSPLGAVLAPLFVNTRFGGGHPYRKEWDDYLNRRKDYAERRRQMIGYLTDTAMRPSFATQEDDARKALGLLPKSWAEVYPIVPNPEPKKRSILDKMKELSTKNKGALIGGIGSTAVAAPVAYAMSKENKLRNAILVGALAGVLGTTAGIGYDKYLA